MRIFFCLALICCSCSSVRNTSVNDSLCIENLKFKEEFIRNLNIIDDFMSIENKEFTDIDEFESVMTEQKIADLNSSLMFISKYTHVSFESMANYNKTYPFGVYEKDKISWLKWYQDNKCKNIQIKK